MSLLISQFSFLPRRGRNLIKTFHSQKDEKLVRSSNEAVRKTIPLFILIRLSKALVEETKEIWENILNTWKFGCGKNENLLDVNK